MMQVESNPERAALTRFWSRHGRLVGTLTGIWAAVSFLPPLLIGSSKVAMFRIPVAAWFMAELAPLVFVLVAWVYARQADALDAEYADRRG
jgi:putative solute:sodium symporter small subunit